MSTTDALGDLVAPIVTARDLDLFDLELAGGVLKVTVDRSSGVNLDEIAAVTRELSRALDEDDPIASRYTLEVSSPGLERTLRTPGHFAWAVGKRVSVKTVPSFEGNRRIEGTLVSADSSGVVLDVEGATQALSYDEIARARTIFEWGPGPKPGKPAPKARDKAGTSEGTNEKSREAS